MAYTVDVAFIGRDGKVLRVLRLAPWRFALCVRAVSVVETRAGVIVDETCRSAGRLERAFQIQYSDIHSTKAGEAHAKRSV
jgi:uncharacterized membrane protein (UPF0127 family)